MWVTADTAVDVSIQEVIAVVSIVMVKWVFASATKFAIWPSFQASSFLLLVVVAVFAVETTLVPQLQVVTIVGGTGTLEITNPVTNVVDFIWFGLVWFYGISTIVG